MECVRRLRYLWWVLLVAPWFWACGGGQDSAPEQEEVPPPLVKCVHPEPLRYSPRLVYNGTTFPSREANLGSVLPGRVERMHFQVGQRVPEGALIVELSDELLIQTKIEHETLKKDYERLKRLQEQGSVSSMQFDHVKAQYQASEAKMEMIRSSTQIHAPFTGILAERMMEVGEVYTLNPGVSPGYSYRSGIVRLMSLDPMVVRLEVNERQLQHIARGMRANVTFDSQAKGAYPGVIREIKPMLSSVTHTASVEVEFRNPRQEILPGMYATVTLLHPEREGLSVPLQCVVKELTDERDYVYLVSPEGVVVQQLVTLVQTVGARAVLQGVETGSLVLMEGKGKCKPGERVRYVVGEEQIEQLPE